MYLRARAAASWKVIGPLIGSCSANIFRRSLTTRLLISSLVYGVGVRLPQAERRSALPTYAAMVFRRAENKAFGLMASRL